MLSRILLAGIVAGVVAGISLTAVQSVAVTPLIQAAETYEFGSSADAAFWVVLGLAAFMAFSRFTSR